MSARYKSPPIYYPLLSVHAKVKKPTKASHSHLGEHDSSFLSSLRFYQVVCQAEEPQTLSSLLEPFLFWNAVLGSADEAQTQHRCKPEMLFLLLCLTPTCSLSWSSSKTVWFWAQHSPTWQLQLELIQHRGFKPVFRWAQLAGYCLEVLVLRFTWVILRAVIQAVLHAGRATVSRWDSSSGFSNSSNCPADCKCSGTWSLVLCFHSTWNVITHWSKEGFQAHQVLLKKMSTPDLQVYKSTSPATSIQSFTPAEYLLLTMPRVSSNTRLACSQVTQNPPHSLYPLNLVLLAWLVESRLSTPGTAGTCAVLVALAEHPCNPGKSGKVLKAPKRFREHVSQHNTCPD